ncbi:SDR family NAD(P)-dependent oxidoreductase [Halocalculus aciditolerans]|uniref:Glucose 1-dehydrogenase n=1 Tax=Halocalculus aciditolerans TaxID=1383812 RepID=A0A830F6H8_9EURY|nr:SDR family NAD(P)-dependent oxidoreductase [Halocalculus aciditolerans]GGL68132.1 glucose 1-dehydrogenase [Halocalculus aciditolerans]
MARTVVVAGVGPGLGASLARKFSNEGCDVASFARTEEYIGELAEDLDGPGDGLAVPVDLREPEEVRQAFDTVRGFFGSIDVLVYNASSASWRGLMDTTEDEFENAWKVNQRGAFVCAQEAVGDMRDEDGGTVIFTGATSAVRSRGGAISFTAGKFGARGMAMDIAQEYGDEGVHAAHVVVDGQIDNPRTRDHHPDRDDDTFLDPDDIADTYCHLVEQDASTQAFEVHLTNGPQTTEFL